MPLKSASCGRELEAGLRRRPGSNNVTFDGKPLDGVFVMHRKPNPWGHMAPQPSTWRGRSEQILLNQVGCEARKIPADAEVFFLDFSFYRTYQACRLKSMGAEAV